MLRWLLTSCLLIPLSVFADTTGVTYGGSAANITGGDAVWNNLSNAIGSNSGTAADSYLDADFYSDTLNIYNYGFSIPTGSTINSITLKIRKNRGTEGGRPVDSSITLTSTGYTSSNKAFATKWISISAETTYTWTAPGDTLPTVANINDSTFGVKIIAVESLGDAVTANVFYASIDIDYTPPAGGPWFDTDWTHCGSVTIESDYVDESIPVTPIYLSGFDSTWWANVQADGDDIRVTEDDYVTERSYYLVNISSGSSIGLIMVNTDGYVDAAVDKTLKVFVGNAAATTGSTTSTFTGTGYVGMYFPGESTADASGGGRTLTAVNSPGTAAAAAYEVDAATYDGSTSYHKYDGTLAPTTFPIGLELLSYSNDNGDGAAHFALGDADAAAITYLYQSASSINVIPRFGTVGIASTNGASKATGVWRYIAGTRDSETSGTSIAYVDGSAMSTTVTTDATARTLERLAIGAMRYGASATGFYFNGNVAFAAISDALRSADYIATMQDAWHTSAFRTYGATEDQPVGGDNTAATHNFFFISKLER